jgi:hypothetical protein
MMIVAILTSSCDRPAIQTHVAVGEYVTPDSLMEQSFVARPALPRVGEGVERRLTGSDTTTPPLLVA